MCKINYYYWHTVFGSVKCYHPIKTSVATMVCFFIPQVQILWRDALVTRWISSRWVSWCHLQKRRVQGVYIGQIPGTHTCTLAYKHTPSDLLNTLKPLMVSPTHTRTHMATPRLATDSDMSTHTHRQADNGACLHSDTVVLTGVCINRKGFGVCDKNRKWVNKM